MNIWPDPIFVLSLGVFKGLAVVFNAYILSMPLLQKNGDVGCVTLLYVPPQKFFKKCEYFKTAACCR